MYTYAKAGKIETVGATTAGKDPEGVVDLVKVCHVTLFVRISAPCVELCLDSVSPVLAWPDLRAKHFSGLRLRMHAV